MADQGQQVAAARGRGGGAAGRGRGGGTATAGRPSQVFLNPERAPPLIAKWQKLLGKDLERLEVVYEENGVTVYLYGKPGTAFDKRDDSDSAVALTVPEYRAIKEREVAPSAEDAKFAFKNKFEVRLNTEFPPGLDLGDGSEAALRSAVQALPFNQRRVMLMSNKQFKSAYPNGLGGAAEAAA